METTKEVPLAVIEVVEIVPVPAVGCSCSSYSSRISSAILDIASFEVISEW